MKYNWIDLPERKNCFTVRSAVMLNLNTGEVIRHYSANTKIAVVQKCITPEGTYYRTSEAAQHYLNYAFKASAFGLPDEKAPSEHSSTPNSHLNGLCKPVSRTPRPAKKQKFIQKPASSKDGETRQPNRWWRKIFRRKNG